MNVIFLENFSKDLDKLKDKKVRQAIKNAILKIENASSLEKVTGLKRLKGEKGAYRLRVGNYRIGLYIQGDTVELSD
ncbi:MAG: hypothetical protein EA390_07420 [Balneolaceae bacterium]|nr:MAG: hypothetical protein EA390_07420 [Balneolaceae bacterium]